MHTDGSDQSHYELLETRIDARRDEIEDAYRAAVKRLQPQIEAGNPHAVVRLRLLCEAYHILTDDERRANYDASLRELVVRPEARSIDGVSWTIVVTLIIVAVGLMLTVFFLVDRAVTTESSPARAARDVSELRQSEPPVAIVPQPGREPYRRGEAR